MLLRIISCCLVFIVILNYVTVPCTCVSVSGKYKPVYVPYIFQLFGDKGFGKTTKKNILSDTKITKVSNSDDNESKSKHKNKKSKTKHRHRKKLLESRKKGTGMVISNILYDLCIYFVSFHIKYSIYSTIKCMRLPDTR